MPDHILVANRGEIAIRVLRTAADLEIESTAVHAKDDSLSLHTRHADHIVDLQEEGVASFEPNAEKVLEILRRGDGFLGLHDKSDPKEISKRLLMSKKSFKRAIGNLYRDQKIKIEKDGIRLA